jgi:hypothetical protein
MPNGASVSSRGWPEVAPAEARRRRPRTKTEVEIWRNHECGQLASCPKMQANLSVPISDRPPCQGHVRSSGVRTTIWSSTNISRGR